MTRKLTTIIVISFVTMLAVLITIVSLLSYRFFFDFTSQEISKTKLTLLNENVDKLTATTNKMSIAAYSLAANEKIVQVFSEPIASSFDAINEQRELRNQLNAMVGLRPEIHSIELYTDRYKEHPFMQEGMMLPLEKLEIEPWFNAFDHMDSGWVRWQINGNQAVSFIHRLVNYRGHKVGYVKVNMLEEMFFADLLLNQNMNPTDEPLLLVDSGGRVMAQTEAGAMELLLQHLTETVGGEPYEQLRSSYMHMSNHYEVMIAGQERYLLLVSKPNAERWRLVQWIPVEPLYAETTKLGWTVLVLGIMVLLLSVPLVYWLGRRIVLAPIRKMIIGMKQVERGRFNTRLDPFYVEEFDYLAQYFNRMTSELEQSIQQIKTEHLARRDAEIKMLQNQIMPHFLYNTLDLIHWKAMDYNADDISVMINSLSKMFRIGLSGGQSFIRLREELEHVKHYIDIQRMRLPDRTIVYEYNVPASCKDYRVPKVILQPIIENSMLHGYPGQANNVVQIDVTVAQVGHALHIEITDDGVGLPADWTLETSKGIGIKNIQERVWMYCGQSYGITLSQREQGGTAAIMTLPVLRTEQEVEDMLAANSNSDYLSGGE